MFPRTAARPKWGKAGGKQSEEIRHIHTCACFSSNVPRCWRRVKQSPEKRGEDRQAGWLKWDGCWLLEGAHSTRLLGLRDNLLLVCENKMWSHTWLLSLLSHLPMGQNENDLCLCVCVWILCRLSKHTTQHAGNALNHAKFKSRWRRQLRSLRTNTTPATGSVHSWWWKLVTHEAYF